MRQYSNLNTFHSSHESRVLVEYYRTLDVCRLEYLKISRMRQYLSMNTIHTSHESRVPVACFGTLACCLTEIRGSVYYLYKNPFLTAQDFFLILAVKNVTTFVFMPQRAILEN